MLILNDYGHLFDWSEAQNTISSKLKTLTLGGSEEIKKIEQHIEKTRLTYLKILVSKFRSKDKPLIENLVDISVKPSTDKTENKVLKRKLVSDESSEPLVKKVSKLSGTEKKAPSSTVQKSVQSSKFDFKNTSASTSSLPTKTLTVSDSSDTKTKKIKNQKKEKRIKTSSTVKE